MFVGLKFWKKEKPKKEADKGAGFKSRALLDEVPKGNARLLWMLQNGIGNPIELVKQLENLPQDELKKINAHDILLEYTKMQIRGMRGDSLTDRAVFSTSLAAILLNSSNNVEETLMHMLTFARGGVHWEIKYRYETSSEDDRKKMLTVLLGGLDREYNAENEWDLATVLCSIHDIFLMDEKSRNIIAAKVPQIMEKAKYGDEYVRKDAQKLIMAISGAGY